MPTCGDGWLDASRVCRGVGPSGESIANVKREDEDTGRAAWRHFYESTYVFGLLVLAVAAHIGGRTVLGHRRGRRDGWIACPALVIVPGPVLCVCICVYASACVVWVCRPPDCVCSPICRRARSLKGFVPASIDHFLIDGSI